MGTADSRWRIASEVRPPRVYRDESRSGIRPVERQALRLLGASDFLSLTVTDSR